MSKTTTAVDASVFTNKLSDYKQLIDADINMFVQKLERETLRHYGAYARLAIDAYSSILQRGGKRIRGSLAMVAYEMAGGKNQVQSLQLARVLEMLHAYILIVDDFQDRSHVRRGGPSAHTLLAQYHSRHELAGDSEHFGASIAMNAALAGNHLAQQAISELDVSPDVKLKIGSMINSTMVTTAHGQTNDIINEVVADVSVQDIQNVLEWKTAHYTFLNPLMAGLALAGADGVAADKIHAYAMNAGKAFQITDDILGTFGSEFESGKSPMDDIREGKRTLIIAHALENTNDDNKNFLVQMLGNESITPVEFERCKDILVESGALEYAQQQAKAHVDAALEALQGAPKSWSSNGIDFLRQLAQQLLGRSK